jgi:hypothetical protein
MLTTGIAALALVALPIGLHSSNFGLGIAQAWANGNGHGNGHGGDHGNGNANGHVTDDTVASASELGALNAAHESPTALANASPNSRVGKIAAYKEAALAAQAADQAVTDAQTAVDGATQAVADAQAALDAANTTGDQTQIDAAQAQLDAANQTLADAQAGLADAQAAASTAHAEADADLAAAANKPITDRVVDAVNSLLGID